MAFATGDLPWAIGLMSGTSCDGVDAALLAGDGVARVETGPWRTQPYDAEFRSALRGVMGRGGADGARVAAVERELTRRHAAAVAALLDRAGFDASRVTVIGFHGQTILHEPHRHRTRQIGDGALLARLTGIDVVCDFRSADVAAGGQGAPLAPLYHAALAAPFKKPLAVLNVGGVANVTWIGEGADALMAFDTGPGNAPVDDWALRHTGRPQDTDGALALAGRVDELALAELLAHPYFAAPPPKSLDRDAFDLSPVQGLSAADGAATLVEFAACAVDQAQACFPAPPRRWIVTGGGRRNPALMAALARVLGAPVVGAEELGWDGDALEAQAFAYLALRSLKGLPLSLPSTTGVPRPMPGGRLFRANAG
jgi:anhydro-N-acetylmuramic acid kinase